MIVSGPTRVVLLHSGKFDFADVELDRAVHLVAPNNVGKTTLIAALQFLYIDRANLMDFSKGLAETRRYYFPDPFSYVLFECLTPKGHQVLGVHGQGPVQSYQYERFRYTGDFRLEDYLDEERRPRRWEDVRARLATRDFALVQPQALPGVLTGLGGRKARGTSFGIVPVRQRNGYDRFRRLFTHLLKLGKLRQEDLKQVTIETWEPDLRQREVDLEGGFRSQFDEVRRQREQVGGLETLVPHIDRAMVGALARDEQREILPALWAGLQASATTTIEQMTSRIDMAMAEATVKAREAEEERGQAEVQNKVHVERQQRVAVLETELSKLDEQAERFRSYQPEFEDAAIRRLADEIGDLEHRLRAARRERLEDVLAELDKAEGERTRIQRRIEQLARLVVTAARTHTDDAQLAGAFALLNPELLGAVVGPDGVELIDQDAALALLRTVARRGAEGEVVLAGVRVAATALPQVDIARYADPALLAEQVGRLDKHIGELSELAQTLRDEEAVRERLGAKQAEHEQRLELRSAYREHRVALARRPTVEAEHAECLQLAKHADAARKGAEGRARVLDGEARSATERAEDLKRHRNELRGELGSLEPPHWPHDPPGSVRVTAELEDLIREYRSRRKKEKQADEQVADALAEVERIAYDQYAGDDERQTLHNLREAREALPERREALDELWRSLIVELRSAFKGLGEDLDTLQAKLNELNRALARTAVSNLDRVALRIERNRELGRYVRDVQRHEAMPLFGSRADAEQALERIGELLRRRPRIRLEDMFDLHFEVTAPDGAQRKYAHLDRIESNGTTVTIKVLVSLHLLRALLTDNRVRIPFFLDEVASLDRGNQRGIVEAAEELGFCPILASPEASDAADVLYYLREDGGGRIVLDPDSAARVEIRRSSVGT